MADEIVDLDSLHIGDVISFKSLNQYDTVTWRGKITGFGDYSLVKQMEDLVPYYQNVKKTQSNMPDIEDLSFIIFDCYENLTTETSIRRIFAKDWIDPSSVRIVDLNKHMDIRIFDVGTADIERLKDILSDHGYSVAVIAVESNNT